MLKGLTGIVNPPFVPATVESTLLCHSSRGAQVDPVFVPFIRRMIQMKRIMAALIAVCAIALAGSPAAAQQTTGNIQGRVTDAQKAAVPGVTVTVKNAATGYTRTETSDSEGAYRLASLPIGTYELKAELSGFT